jgi:hypothetical protein
MIRLFWGEALMLKLCIPTIITRWDNLWIILIAAVGLVWAYYSIKKKVRHNLYHWRHSTNKIKNLFWKWGNSDAIWKC